MKKKVWKFAIFSVVLVTAIILIIVFAKKPNSSSTDEGFKPSSVSITLNMPEVINIYKGNSVEIPSNAVVVKPADKFSALTSKVVLKNEGAENGIVFENNIITANYVGEYAIEFSVPKSETDLVSKQQRIIVHEDVTNTHVRQINKEFSNTSQPNLSSLFSFDASDNYTVETSAGLILSNGMLTAGEPGVYIIKFTFIDIGIKYFYNFQIEVTKTSEEITPQYKISVIDLTNDELIISLSQPSKMLGYIVENASQSSAISQSVNVISGDTSVASAEIRGDGLLYIEVYKVGEVTITLTYSLDSSVSYSFIVRII